MFKAKLVTSSLMHGDKTLKIFYVKFGTYINLKVKRPNFQVKLGALI